MSFFLLVCESDKINSLAAICDAPTLNPHKRVKGRRWENKNSDNQSI